MNKVVRKLKSKKGASIIIALMIFLLCALAGASAFIMASANVGRYAHTQDSRQPYYSVTSAALTVVDLIDGMTYTSDKVSYDYKREWAYEADQQEHVQSEKYTITIPEKGKGGLASGDGTMRGSSIMTSVSDYCDLLVPYLNIPKEWYSTLSYDDAADKHKPTPLSIPFTITPSVGNAGEVQCTLIMNLNYHLLFTFSCKSGNSNLYSVNLYWEAEVDDPITTKQPEYVYTENGNTGSMHIQQTKTVTVIWKKENVTLSRGEATPDKATSPSEEG